MGSPEDGNENRREITLHSFRRFVKTTISDLGYSDYSEWFIGHSGSTYWRKKDLHYLVNYYSCCILHLIILILYVIEIVFF